MGPLSFFCCAKHMLYLRNPTLEDLWSVQRETVSSGFWCGFNFLVKSSSIFFLMLKKDLFCTCQNSCINPATGVETDLLFFTGMLIFLAHYHVGWLKYFVLSFPGLLHQFFFAQRGWCWKAQWFYFLTKHSRQSVFGMCELVWKLIHLSHLKLFLPTGNFLCASHISFFPCLFAWSSSLGPARLSLSCARSSCWVLRKPLGSWELWGWGKPSQGFGAGGNCMDVFC